ncbi:MAG: FKBP-type peptidyl-prolyl cis-trans isomerase [Chitinophagaceae bacterium]|nr:FKBP-type peptidyl-prolyl cis-trans isomerase [Chitinophagaceae bacterium]
MKRITLSIVGLGLMAGAIAQVKKPATAAKAPAAKTANTPGLFKSSNDSASYALGIRVAQNLKQQGFDGMNVNLLQKALSDVLQNKKIVLPEELLDGCINSYVTKVSEAKIESARKAARVFLDANAKKPGVVTLPSGLQYEVMKTGASEEKPSATDRVKCHYHGTLTDGTVFESSVQRGEPVVFAVNGVIQGWQEALQLMTVGSKWRLFVPADLAYGDRSPGPQIPSGATLIFEVELIAIEH